MTAAVAGLALGMSLILAIGAQNAFVLRQGLMRSHVFVVCLFCSLSDAILIAAGVLGFGALAQAMPWFETAMRYGGAAVLVWYGIKSARAAIQGGEALDVTGTGNQPLGPTLATIAALTWLNPHVYLDTLVLVGSVAAQYESRLAFGAGVTASSFLFFFALGYGARYLAPLFRNPRAWQILEGLVALTMWAIAAKLVFAI